MKKNIFLLVVIGLTFSKIALAYDANLSTNTYTHKIVLQTKDINPITPPPPVDEEPLPQNKKHGKPLIPDPKPVIGNPESSRIIDRDTSVPEVTHIN